MVIRFTARTSLLLFCLAFSAAALARLWPNAWTRWQRRNRRYLGVTFAASHGIHAVAIACLRRHGSRRLCGGDLDRLLHFRRHRLCLHHRDDRNLVRPHRGAPGPCRAPAACCPIQAALNSAVSVRSRGPGYSRYPPPRRHSLEPFLRGSGFRAGHAGGFTSLSPDLPRSAPSQLFAVFDGIVLRCEIENAAAMATTVAQCQLSVHDHVRIRPADGRSMECLLIPQSDGIAVPADDAPS